MKPTKTKDEVRSEIQNQVEQFLNCGGHVNAYDRGLTGLGSGASFSHPFTPGQTQTRTPVLDAVKAIDSRRQASKETSTPRRRRKVLLKDDFGDPIRWVWQDAR